MPRVRRWYPGSIPACAGEPDRLGPDPDLAQVYPRVCGGTGEEVMYATMREGLSPRVRGNRWCYRDTVGDDGSIPACAGEPCLKVSVPPVKAVYPRVCGGTVVD